MMATWKMEPALQPPEKDCDFMLKLDELMNPVRTEECREMSRQVQQQAQALNPITPESLSNWGGDHDLILANGSSMSPLAGWM